MEILGFEKQTWWSKANHMGLPKHIWEFNWPVMVTLYQQDEAQSGDTTEHFYTGNGCINGHLIKQK